MFWKFVGTCLVILTAYVTMAVLNLPFTQEMAVMECKAKFSVPPEDVELLKERKLPESRDGKCMMACILKKMKVMTKRGQFDLRNVQKWVRNKYHGDHVNLVKGNAVAETCAKMLPSLGVKDECDMAGEIMSCVKRESKLVKNTNGYVHIAEVDNSQQNINRKSRIEIIGLPLLKSTTPTSGEDSLLITSLGRCAVPGELLVVPNRTYLCTGTLIFAIMPASN